MSGFCGWFQVKLTIESLDTAAVGCDQHGLISQTGVRISEALGLKWDCVDLESGCVVIRRSLVDVRGRPYLQEKAKTKSSVRRITLNAVAEAAMLGHRTQMQFEGQDDAHGFVFCKLSGEHLVRRTVLDQHRRILKRANLPPVTLHEMRHTVGTLLAEFGEHPKTIADLLGHSTTQITCDFDTHTSEGIHSAAMEKLAAAAGGASGSSAGAIRPKNGR